MLRGCVAGLATGAVWWAVEATLNWTAGGLVPARVAAQVAGLDLAIGGVAGAGLGLVLGGGVPLGLALAVVYGFWEARRSFSSSPPPRWRSARVSPPPGRASGRVWLPAT